MKRGPACIMCTGTDYAQDCANGQCAAEQLDMLEGPQQAQIMPAVTWRHPVLEANRHDRGWPRG